MPKFKISWMGRNIVDVFKICAVLCRKTWYYPSIQSCFKYGNSVLHRTYYDYNTRYFRLSLVEVPSSHEGDQLHPDIEIILLLCVTISSNGGWTMCLRLNRAGTFLNFGSEPRIRRISWNGAKLRTVPFFKLQISLNTEWLRLHHSKLLLKKKLNT